MLFLLITLVLHYSWVYLCFYITILIGYLIIKIINYFRFKRIINNTNLKELDKIEKEM